jgi:7-cyano-7-deazaguanine tRNA-ribosyltransferase
LATKAQSLIGQPVQISVGGQTQRLPMMWIGQSVDTSLIHTSIREYHGLPVLTSLGCAIRRPSLLARHFGPDLKARLNVRGPLMLDSGGFAMMKRRIKSWTVRDVSIVYERVDADLVVSLDIPPRLSEPPRIRAEKLRRTLSNLAYLAPKFGTRLVPVVQGRTVLEIEKSCEGILRSAPSPIWIGIGGLVPLILRSGMHKTARADTPQMVIAQTIRVVRSYFPNSVLHVFGVGSAQTMLALFGLGAHSADSIGWRQAAGFGSIYLPGRNQRLLSWKSNSPQPRPIINEAELALLARCACPACGPIERIDRRIKYLEAGFEARSIHNLWVLRNEIDALISARSANREKEFLAERLSGAWTSVILN